MRLKKNRPTRTVFALLIIGSISLFLLTDKGFSNTQVSFADSDQDGLSNDEERSYGTNPNVADSDNDGYSDGVEIKSGFDPLKAAPGDRIMQSGVEGENDTQEADSGTDNLTRDVSDKLSAYIQKNGSKEGDFGMEELDSIIAETIDDKISEENLPEIDPKTIKIKKQEYPALSEEERKRQKKEDAIEYLTTIAYVAASNSPEQIHNDNDLAIFSQELANRSAELINGSSGMEYFDDLADRGTVFLSQMDDIEVPEELMPLHIKGLQLARYSLDLKNRTNIDPGDPMAVLVSLSRVQNALEKGFSYYEEIVAELERLGVAIDK